MAIVAAVDGDKRPDRVVNVGQDLAETFGEELVVLHVMSEGEFNRRREEREYYVDQAGEDAAKTARWVVTGTLEEHDEVVLEGRVGEPVDEILAEAEKRDARFLVVGGRKRTPVGKAVFGSVTQSVMLNSEIPVVTVLDEGA